MLDVALNSIARGWYVFPCWPRSKRPMTAHGWKDASNQPEVIRAWWTKTPDANVAIACNPSNLAVLDCDYGLVDAEDARELMTHLDSATYAVRTGRRDSYGVQFYFVGAIPDVGTWRIGERSGQVKSLGGYVMAAGCVHPDSGERYDVLFDIPLVPTPDRVRMLKTEPVPSSHEPGKKIPEGAGRHDALMREACRLRARGMDGDAIYAVMQPMNEAMCEVPISDEDLQEMCRGIERRYPPGEVEPVAILGSGKTAQTSEEAQPVDWRTRYVTLEQVRDAKPTSFLIEGFLALDSITALAAPVGQRKSLISLNVAYALCTGEPLFDYFQVTKQPERVLYLCPEMGLSSFSTRLKQIGLLDYVGRSLFCQTMDEQSVKLRELNDELPGAVVIIDTLTRFVDGDQNSSQDMSKFAEDVFRLKRCGATVLLLHHSVKGAGTSPVLTLDSAMRGSTELAAFVTSCWATRLKDPDDPYNSPSVLVNVKQRDFESKPFEATSDTNCRMHIVGEPGQVAVLKSRKDAEAEQVLAALLTESPEMGINKIQAALRAAGHKKGVQWVTRARSAALGTGVTLTAV